MLSWQSVLRWHPLRTIELCCLLIHSSRREFIKHCYDLYSVDETVFCARQKEIAPRATPQNFRAVEMELAMIAMIAAGVAIFILCIVAVVILVYEERNLRRALHPDGSSVAIVDPLRLSQGV
jgi:uridine phosphorylase